MKVGAFRWEGFTMAFLDFIRQNQQPPAPSPMDYQVRALQTGLAAYMQGDQMRRQREEEARKREAEAAAAKRQAEQDEIARTKRALEMGQLALTVGNNEAAAGILGNLQSSGALQRYAGISGPQIKGATVTDPQAVAQRDFAIGMMGNPLMAAFANPEALSAPTTRQDFSGQATTNALAGVFGQPKPDYREVGGTLLQIQNGKATPVFTAQPKPSTAVTYGAPQVDPQTGLTVQTASNGRIVPVPGQGGSGSQNMRQTNTDFTNYLANRYGIKFGPQSGYRPAGTIKGETGVHSTWAARDVAVDPNTPLGQQIVADAHAAGFYTYTKNHGTGPHVHIEFNRNPDGSMKAGGRGRGSSGAAGQPKQTEINSVLSTVDKLRRAIERKYTTGTGNERTVNRGAFEREFYPKAEKILRAKGLNPKDYLPDFDRTPGFGLVAGPPDPSTAPAAPARQAAPTGPVDPAALRQRLQGLQRRGSLQTEPLTQTSMDILRDVGLA